MNCIFCKIVNKECPARIVFEDAHTLVFMDIAKDVDGHSTEKACDKLI